LTPQLEATVAHDEPYPPAHDLSAYRRARRDRADQAMIELFAGILGKPMEVRELTPEERARREDRVRARHETRQVARRRLS
jgi:hypothetical protein